MSWLEDRLAKLAPFRKGGASVAERDEAVVVASLPQKQNPPLMLLVNDASGRASFKTHVFDSAESATDFVLYWFPQQTEGGVLAFWAMTQAPEFGLDSPYETEVEALVMIRDVKRDGVVYLFSFVDMNSAQEFLRQEVHHGTDLSLMLLYWAVPVRLTADPWGRMMLTPSTPPGAAPQVEEEAPAGDRWSPPPAMPDVEVRHEQPAEEPVDVFEEAPNARTGVADPMGGIDETFELTSWMDRPAKKSRNRHATPAPEDAFEPRRRNRLGEDLELAREALEAPEMATAESAPAEPEIVAFDEPAEASVEFEGLNAMIESAPEPVAVVSEEQAEPAEAAEMAIELTETPAEPVMADEAPEILTEPEAAPELSAPPLGETPVLVPISDESVPIPEPSPEVVPAELEATPDPLEPEVRRKKMRARTNGNGHKPLPSNGKANGAASSQHIVAEVQVNGNGAKVAFPADDMERTSDDNPVEISSGEAALQQSVEAESDGNSHVDESLEISVEIQIRSARALKVKRWEVKEEPFQGFDSPPGKF